MEFTNFIFSNAFILMFLPIWVAFLITLNFTVPSFRSKHFTRNLTLISTGICAVYSICLLYVTSSTRMFINNEVIDWLFIDKTLYFSMGFLLDNLSAVFLVMLTIISFFIQLYSHEYMKNDECFHRYFVYLNILNFSMSGLIISTNLVQAYIFLVLIGVCSYLLSGFWFKKKSVSDAAQKSFIINTVGDCLFLLGNIFLLYFAVCYFPEEDFSTLNFSVIYNISQGVIPYASDFGFYIICLTFILGLLIKTAQFPFHIWHTNVKETPIPAMALISSSASITAGIYLLVRLLPMFNLSPWAIKTILYLGLFSMLICSFLAIFQNDIRKILSYILYAQTGLVLSAVSILNISTGLFHVVSIMPAISSLFLTSGMIGALYNNDFDIRYMGSLRKNKPVITGIFLISVLSLSGIFLSGYFSENKILSGFLHKGMVYEYAVILISLFFISFTLFKTYFLIFEKDAENKLCDIKFHLPVKISLAFLTAFIILSGFLFKNNFSGMFDINSQPASSVKGLIIFSTVNILGFITALFLYKTKLLNKISSFNINILEEDLYINKAGTCFSKYIYKPVCKIFEFFDKYIIDGIPKLTGIIVKLLSVLVTKIQTGDIQTYILNSVFGIILALLFVLFYYFKLKGF